MANYTVLNPLGAGINSARFFQTGDGGELMGWDSNSITVRNPDGTIIAMVGTGIVLTDIGGGEMVPTAGTISDITLYQADFTTQLIGISGLAAGVVGLYNAWQVDLVNVFNFLLSGNDTVNGSDGNDALFGGAGNDTLTGGIGDDYLEPGKGTDTVNGGDGRDIVGYANASNDPNVTKGLTADLTKTTITDPWGNTDTISSIEGLRGTKYVDTLTGNAGDNRFEGLGGNDIIDGGAGIDQIRYNRDVTYGGAQGVVVNLDTGTAKDGFGSLDSFTNIEAVVGTDAGDTLTGGNNALPNNAAYELYGLGGNDTLNAGSFDMYAEPGAGNDTIVGGAGNDQVSYAEYTGANGATFNLANKTVADPYGGTDTLDGSIEGVRGTRNADIIIGDGLNNFFRGLGGNDAISGGQGSDQVRYDRDAQYGGTLGVTVNLALGTATDGFGDTDSLSSIENVRGTNQADTLTGDGSGNVFQGLGGDDTIDGGAGIDTVEYAADAAFGGTAGVTVNLATGKATDGFGNTDTLTSIETARGTAGADTLVGGNAPLSGTDLYTLGGLDGNDTLTAGSYDSLLMPGAGDDTVTGGTGADQISYEEYTGSNGAVINLATGVVADPYGGTDTLSGSIEGVRGTRNADTITGNSSNNFFRGMAGNDTINGGGGTDQVRYDRDAQAGGNGNVVVDLASGKATDGFGNTDTLTSIENIRGSNNNDELRGDANDNAIQGMGGNDLIDGRAGRDVADYSADTLGIGIKGVTVDLAAATATDGQGGTDTLLSIEGARGSSGDDTLTGGDTAIPGIAYQLFGMAGDDTIKAGAFDAYIEPGAGDDTVTGGAGFDQLSYSEYTGTKGVDANLGTGIVLDPYGGKDTVTGGIEALRGTRNADVLVGNGSNNHFRGLAGNDTISGGDGLDRVRYDLDAQFGGSNGVVVDLAKGTATDGFGNTDTLLSIEQVEGTAFADTLTGGDTNPGANASWELLGRGGDDVLTAGGGTAYIEPGAGNDTIVGRAGVYVQLGYADFTNGVGVSLDLSTGSVIDPLGGTDTFTNVGNARGTSAADTITGNAANNEISGLKGADTLNGGGGSDMVRYDRDANYSGKGAVTVDLQAGTATDGFGDADTLSNFENVRGTNAAQGDVLRGDANANSLQGLAGDDTIDGRGGHDTADYSRDFADGGAAGVVVHLGKGTATDGYGGSDTLISIEAVRGTEFADTLTGGDTNLGANASWDLLGRGGDDTLVSGAGSAYIEPGAGNDTIVGMAGVYAQISYADFNNGVGVSLDLSKGSVIDPLGGSDSFTNVANARGTSAADSITGNAANNEISGLKGADTLNGGGGSDMVRYDRDVNYGGKAAVTVNLALGTAIDGFGDSDTLSNFENVRGTNAELGDTLTGDSSNNRFQGLRGADLVDGGAGIDTADYSRDAADGGATGVTVNLGSSGQGKGSATDGYGSADTLLNIENVIGTAYADTITGDGAANVLSGGLGDDAIDGGDGDDTAVFSGASASYTVTTGAGGAVTVTGQDGKDTLTNVEYLRFSDATVALTATSYAIAAVSASQAEGTGSGTTAFTFRITREGGTSAQTIGWSTAGIAGPGTVAASASDFEGGAFPSGTASFAAGETSTIITVPVLRDAAIELNERFAVTLSGAPAGATIATASAQGVIFNDDSNIAIKAATATKPEGTGGTSAFTFSISRSGATAAGQTVDWAVAGIAGAGTVPASASDFAGGVLPSGTVTFAAGETSRVITVNVAADTAPELNERFAVALSNASGGATITTASAEGVILNDDSNLAIAATSAAKAEGTGGTTAFTFTLSRTGAMTAGQTVDWAVAGVAGSGTVPANAADFDGGVLPSGTVTFAAGETSRVITVNVAADSAAELNERFALTLSNATGGATITTASAQGVILNDDTNLAVRATSAVKAEGTGGTTAFTFTLSRTGATTAGQTVDWAVAGASGSGTLPAAAADFDGGVLPSGTVTFAAGETSRVITVNVAADSAAELNERFALTLSNATGGATITGASAEGVIVNDDTNLAIRAVSAAKPEGHAGSTAFTFSVSRSGLSPAGQTVDWAVAGASGPGTVAANASDFAGGVLPSGTITFAAGETSRQVTVNVAGDAAGELNERFGVTLSNAGGGATITGASAQGVIYNDDFVSTVSNQTLNGTSAADLFLLGGGLDTVTGNAGVDSFRFLQAAIGSGATNASTIQDFNPVAGEKLDLSAIDAIAGTLANDAFTFNPVAGAAFSGAGSLVWQVQGDKVAILGDVNGDSTADLTIFIRPVGTPDSTWFTL